MLTIRLEKAETTEVWVGSLMKNTPAVRLRRGVGDLPKGHLWSGARGGASAMDFATHKEAAEHFARSVGYRIMAGFEMKWRIQTDDDARLCVHCALPGEKHTRLIRNPAGLMPLPGAYQVCNDCYDNVPAGALAQSAINTMSRSELQTYALDEGVPEHVVRGSRSGIYAALCVGDDAGTEGAPIERPADPFELVED